MKKILLVVGAIITVLMVTACPEPEPELSNEKVITAFSFTADANDQLESDIEGTIDGTDISLTVPSGTDVKALVATVTTTGASVSIGETEQTSSTTPNDFTSDITYTVTAEDGTTEEYTVTVTDEPNTAKAITAFSLPADDNTALESDVEGTIDGTDITLTVPYGTVMTSLVATFTTTGDTVTIGETEQTSGTTATDFTSPVTY